MALKQKVTGDIFAPRKIPPKYKTYPLKKLYYGKYCYKITLKSPYTSMYDLFTRSEERKHILPFNIKLNKEEQKQEKIKEKIAIRYLKIIEDHIEEFYGKDIKRPKMSFSPLKSYIYANNHTFYFEKEGEYKSFRKRMIDFVKECEEPVNDIHVSIMEEDIFLERRVQKKLFLGRFRYKASVHPIYTDFPAELEKINHIFEGRNHNEVEVCENICSISICVNDKKDLLLVKMSVPNVKKYYEAITIEELEREK